MRFARDAPPDANEFGVHLIHFYCIGINPLLHPTFNLARICDLSYVSLLGCQPSGVTDFNILADGKFLSIPSIHIYSEYERWIQACVGRGWS